MLVDGLWEGKTKCIRDKEGKLAAWVIVYETGAIGMLTTLEGGTDDVQSAVTFSIRSQITEGRN